MFPSLSPIEIDADRSVSIIGRSADDGSRVTLDGLGNSRLFLVKTGGTLYLTNLNLVNGSAPDPSSDCSSIDTQERCSGGAVFINAYASLIMEHCDIHGLGEAFLSADWGAGIFVKADGATVSIHNCTFENLAARYGTAIGFFVEYQPDVPSQLIVRASRFVNNYATETFIVYPYQYETYLYFYDCVWLNNKGVGLGFRINNGLTVIQGCAFLNNLAGGDNGFNNGAAIMLTLNMRADISDCRFEYNLGNDGGAGIVRAQEGAFATLRNCSFVQNTAYNGGALAAVSGASLTAISCHGHGNTANQRGGLFYADDGEITIINSTFTEGYAGLYAAIGIAYEDSIIILKNSVFSNSRTGVGLAGFYFLGCDVRVIDCVVANIETPGILTWYSNGGANVHIVRTRLEDHRAGTGLGACLYVSSIDQ